MVPLARNGGAARRIARGKAADIRRAPPTTRGKDIRSTPRAPDPRQHARMTLIRQKPISNTSSARVSSSRQPTSDPAFRRRLNRGTAESSWVITT